MSANVSERGHVAVSNTARKILSYRLPPAKQSDCQVQVEMHLSLPANIICGFCER